MRGLLQTAAVNDSAFDDLARQIERDLKRQRVDYYINADNDLIKQLSRMPDIGEPARQDMLHSLYNAAVLNSMHRLSPDNAKMFYEQIHHQIKRLLDLETELELLRDERARLREKVRSGDNEEAEDRDWVRLFVMMPYEPEYRALEDALRNIFEAPPYWFDLQLARDTVFKRGLVDNLRSHMLGSDGYIADATLLSPNVMLELGRVHLSQDLFDRPLFILWCAPEAKKPRLPVDLGDVLYMSRHELTLPTLTDSIRGELKPYGKHLEQLKAIRPKRFLSKTVMHAAKLSDEQSELIRRYYKTVEDLESAEASPPNEWGLRGAFYSALDGLKRLK